MPLFNMRNPWLHTYINLLIVFVIGEAILIAHHGVFLTFGGHHINSYLLGTVDTIIMCIILTPLIYLWHKYITVKL